MRLSFLHVSTKDQIVFARNISLMSQSGMPLLDSLQMIQRQTSSSSLRKILTTAIADLQNGQFLSTSFKRYENIFGSLFINIIRIGEASGTLAENFGFLADELKKKQALRGKIVNAMIYPVVIIITTFLLAGVLSFLVFPKIRPIFDSFNVQLPLTTRILIASNDVIRHNWLWILLGIVGLVVGVMLLLRVKPIRRTAHRMLLRIPIAGPLIKSFQMAVFARTFALLLKSGVKIVEALSITAEIVPNLTYQTTLATASEQVKKGASLGEFLVTQPKLFPLMFGQMIQVSELAGTLDTTLFYLSEYYENELSETTQNMVALLEPVLMVAMGGMVGFIAISIVLPIYSISQTISQ